MIAVFVPAFAWNETFFSTDFSPIGERNVFHRDIAAQIGDRRLLPQRWFRSIQHHADAHVRRAGLRDDVAHEADEDDREDENREIGVERREIAQRHAAGDHEMTAERQNDDGRDVDGQGDRRDQAREQAQDAETDVARLGIGLHEFLRIRSDSC